MRAGPASRTRRETVSASALGELAARVHAPKAALVEAAAAARALRTNATTKVATNAGARRKLNNGPERERVEQAATTVAAARRYGARAELSAGGMRLHRTRNFGANRAARFCGSMGHARPPEARKLGLPRADLSAEISPRIIARRRAFLSQPCAAKRRVAR